METGRAPSQVALNRKDLELLCSRIGEDRMPLGAKTARLMFLTQPSGHPHRRKIWTKGIRDFALVERAGTPPYWAEPPGEFFCGNRYRTKDGDDLALYAVFLAGKDTAKTWFKEVVSESAALLFPDADIPELDLVRELFEFCRLNGLLKWQINEETDHPETRGQIAWLHDPYGATIRFLNAASKRTQKVTIGVGGRPRIDGLNEKLRLDLLERWDKAKTTGTSAKDFCRDERIKTKTLNCWVDWRSRRQRRSRQTPARAK